jgi:hypothetical protein
MSFSRSHKTQHYSWHWFKFENDNTNRWAVHRWCCSNVSDKWSVLLNTYDNFFIESDRDAMMFKLAWADAIHRKKKP